MKKALLFLPLVLTVLMLSADSVRVRMPAPVMKQKNGEKLIRILVLDFSNADTKGSKRFMEPNIKNVNIPPQQTLNEADRKSVNSVMQGFIRLLDAWDNSKTGNTNRAVGMANNKIEYDKAVDLYRTIVKGPQRQLVTGADYLAARLGKHSELFALQGSSRISSAMDRIVADPSFPQNAMLEFARLTGITHLIVGTVADPVSETRVFKGYGIETKTVRWKLQVMIRVIDLVRQGTVYSGVFTGTRTDRQLPTENSFTNDLYQVLLHDALDKAAEDLCQVSRPGPGQKIRPQTIPQPSVQGSAAQKKR